VSHVENHNRIAALLSATLYAATPFYLLNSGFYHSHILSALLILFIALCCLVLQSVLIGLSMSLPVTATCALLMAPSPE
jgi:hypothetical protein